jgi:hypothetical protein
LACRNRSSLRLAEDGQVPAHGAGVSRFELLFDDAGTPGDPDDDVFVGRIGGLNCAGLDYDLCATIAAATG